MAGQCPWLVRVFVVFNLTVHHCVFRGTSGARGFATTVLFKLSTYTSSDHMWPYLVRSAILDTVAIGLYNTAVGWQSYTYTARHNTDFYD